MKTKLILFLSLFLTFNLMAQDRKAVVLTVENEKITVEDFESIFKKNNNKDEPITRAALDEYMELFVTFRLKVHEARQLGMDTTSAFQNELAGYRRQLARPYLTDGSMLDKLIQEAYERRKVEVKASHILVQVDPNATPADTIRAWERINKLRERVTSGGEDFAKVAKSKGGSEDPSVQQNGGNLGYFTVFQMVYPFEQAAYATPVGQISRPIRSRFGYHIVKVEDRRPARGEIKAAHIMIRETTKGDPEAEKEAKRKIDEIWDQLNEGVPFQELAMKHSQDNSSSRQGGELPWFGTGKMVESFEEASFALAKDGDYSEPFLTDYGWHIVKRLDYRPIASFEEMKGELRNKVSRDQRAEVTRTSMIQKLKMEYNLKTDAKTLKMLEKKADTNIFRGNFRLKEKELNKPLLSFADKRYTVRDFRSHLEANSAPSKGRDARAYLREQLDKMMEEKLLDYEDSRLELKHNDFRLLMNEYHDGILLFELTDKKVWNKAIRDSLGLAEFHKANSRNYMWPERFKCTIYSFATPEMAREFRKIIGTKNNKRTPEEIVTNLNQDRALNASREVGTYTTDEREVLSKIERKRGMSSDISHNGRVFIVDVEEILPPSPKSLDEAKGQVTADYQTHLEKLWVEELRQKYKWSVNREVLHSIK